MVRGAFDLARSLVALPFYQSTLKRRARRDATIDAHLRTAFDCQYGPLYIMPFQVPSEIKALLELVESKRCARVLEIGSSKGGTIYLFSRVAAPDATIVTVDLPGHTFRGHYPKWKEPLYRSFAGDRQTLVPMRGDSHTAETADRVFNALGRQGVDFLFIDGDHRYEGAKDDFERYRAFVNPGGIIAFHDVVPGPEEMVGGVPRLWQELKAQYAHRELVESWTQGGFGIGVLEDAGTFQPTGV